MLIESQVRACCTDSTMLLLMLRRVYGDITLQSLTFNTTTTTIIIVIAVQLMAASIISQGLSTNFAYSCRHFY